MTNEPKGMPRGRWTPAEIASQAQADRARQVGDHAKTPGARLEETLRLSRFISELRQGMPDDVRAR